MNSKNTKINFLSKISNFDLLNELAKRSSLDLYDLTCLLNDANTFLKVASDYFEDLEDLFRNEKVQSFKYAFSRNHEIISLSLFKIQGNINKSLKEIDSLNTDRPKKE